MAVTEFEKNLPPKIRNVVFDFGGVLVDWNPRYAYKDYFKSEEELDWFLENICNTAWNVQQDGGRSFDEGVALLQKEHPEYSDAIARYRDCWPMMLGGELTENVEMMRRLKAAGYGVYGLTNWSMETFPIARAKYSCFDDLDGMVVSGQEYVVKPDIRIFQILLDRYHLKAEECIFIDDHDSNFGGALQLGMSVINVADIH